MWSIEEGVSLKDDGLGVISFFHNSPQETKGIILNYDLLGDFNINFKLKYAVIVNFYCGNERIVNFRNEAIKTDLSLSVNVWHNMEFSRNEGIISVKVDGNIVKTVKNNQSSFSIKVYNPNRVIQIKDLHILEDNNLANNTANLSLEEKVSNLESLFNNINDEFIKFKNQFPNPQRRYDDVLNSYNNLSMSSSW